MEKLKILYILIVELYLLINILMLGLILEIEKIMDENTQAFHKIKEYPTEFLEYSFKKNIDSEHLQIKSPGNQAEQAFFSYFLAGYPSVFLTIVPFQI